MSIKFLLHACCAPCSIAVIDELKSKFVLTVFFYNPNIHPEEEYKKRKAELVKVCKEWGVPMVDMDYDADRWHKIVGEGLSAEGEGGTRCFLCFKFRLAKVADYAAKNCFQYFGTSLSSGRNKNAEVINDVGRSFAAHYKIKYYAADWKKGGRQEKARQMAAERGIYRQDYCGCVYSFRDKREE
ncbi:epoxyqueuosine reductase QueH [Patescibacteria group bacterium]|nr:MAG: epoxyqueuosine reductase QueH [Patescibacteria group bacterium]